MKKIYLKFETLWFQLSQPLRFLLVGGFNTLASFLIFSGIIMLHIKYPIAIIITYIICLNLSIFTMRYYVFQSRKNIFKEYYKALSIYLSCLLINYIFLYVFTDILQINPIYTQGAYTIISSLYLYYSHKNFSFH